MLCMIIEEGAEFSHSLLYVSLLSLSLSLSLSKGKETNFVVLAKTYSSEECRATIYGTYHFTYEFREGDIGICDNPISRLVP